MIFTNHWLSGYWLRGLNENVCAMIKAKPTLGSKYEDEM